MQNVVEISSAKSQKIHWNTIVAVVLFHVGAVAAFFTFSWQNFAGFVLLWWVANSLGIGLGYHRLLTHRGFQSPKWFEYLLTFFGTMALQSGAISWVTTHRLHHAFTDTDKDPHSPVGGFWWSHIGWIFKGTAQIQPEATMMRYSPDLMKDRVHRVMNQYYWVTSILTGVACFLIGGWGMLFWAVGLRTVFGWHTTWFVNSVTHLWGSRRFETRDTSTNNGIVAALTFGEGWHNNHHAFPRSARHGLTWREFDFNWLQIKTLEKLGLANDVYAYDLNEGKEIHGKPIKQAA
ncbi:MAG: fatty acid desaturase [Acidobacteria bacterium]|nr:fatty acid desaturase [Acidobacteriota bacterium]MBK8147663.1 fatty acid desaturase [Acidobacteriota bacterium]MBK8809544.1 fatty acid desaturase [Acidobacteriota bacterium]